MVQSEAHSGPLVLPVLILRQPLRAMAAQDHQSMDHCGTGGHSRDAKAHPIRSYGNDLCINGEMVVEVPHSGRAAERSLSALTVA